MGLIDLIEQERILNYEVGLKNRALKNILLFFEENSPIIIEEIEKDYFHVLIQDIWSLLQLQQEYKFSWTEQNVRFKKMRQFLLETIAHQEQIIKNTAYFSVSPIKNYIIATIFVKKMRQWLNDNIGFSNFIQLEFTEESANCHPIKNKYIQELTQFFDEMIIHTIEQIAAAEQILGTTFWAQLKPSEIDQLIQRIESNHFTEIYLMREKMRTAECITLHKNSGKKANSTFVFCVQQDLSMQAFANLQTCIALNLLDLSKQNNHDFMYLPFADKINQETVVLKGELDLQKYLEMSESYIGGDGKIGYKKALNFAFTLLKLELSSASGRIYLLCNEKLFENFSAEGHWKEAVLKFKSEKDIEITVIYAGEKELLTPIWFADQVFSIEESVVPHH